MNAGSQGYAVRGFGQAIVAAKTLKREKPKSAIVVVNPLLKMLYIDELSTAHCTCALIEKLGYSFYAISHYFQHKDPIEIHIGHLRKVLTTLRGKQVLICMDANARYPLWSLDVDTRGEKRANFLTEFGLEVLNRIEEGPTYSSPRGESHIDVTVATQGLSQYLSKWSVEREWVQGSDHMAIGIQLGRSEVQGATYTETTRRFNVKAADWEAFGKLIPELESTLSAGPPLDSPMNIDRFAVTLADELTDICEKSMPRRKAPRKANPWWNSHLSCLKRSVYRLRHRSQRTKKLGTSAHRTTTARLRYRQQVRMYSREIKRAKTDSWKKFVTTHGTRKNGT
ncbi:uncharacterized protein [Chelonus insularis]|uniref:uncharacterized protein n=1 Tax=Chelonus insularis TaxID=460826 RepID=UPI00158F578D|nr:uncharacterized protein LOC118070602 [Chelonus insularis]